MPECVDRWFFSKRCLSREWQKNGLTWPESPAFKHNGRSFIYLDWTVWWQKQPFSCKHDKIMCTNSWSETLRGWADLPVCRRWSHVFVSGHIWICVGVVKWRLKWLKGGDGGDACCFSRCEQGVILRFQWRKKFAPSRKLHIRPFWPPCGAESVTQQGITICYQSVLQSPSLWSTKQHAVIKYTWQQQQQRADRRVRTNKTRKTHRN